MVVHHLDCEKSWEYGGDWHFLRTRIFSYACLVCWIRGFVSSVESRFRRGTGSLLESPKQDTETKIYKCSAVARSSSDSRCTSWRLASFSLLVCPLWLFFVGSSSLAPLLCSLFSALFCGQRSISFYALGGQFWLTVTDSRSWPIRYILTKSFTLPGEGVVWNVT